MEFSPNELRYELPERKKNPISGLTPKEMDMLDLFILAPFMRFNDIWKMITDDKRSQAAIKASSSAFLISYDSQVYLTDRKSQIDAYFKPDNNILDNLEEIPADADERIKKMMWNKIKDGNIDNKAAEWWFKDVLKDREVETEVAPPLRILAESCYSCRYKAACETELYDGCKYCKYKKYANKNGVKYTYKDQLDLPKDFYEHLKPIEE